MKHEKIIKRYDGSRVLIRLATAIGYNESDLIWNTTILYASNETCRFDYGHEDKVTPEEIYTAKLEAWESLKPKM